MLSFTMSAIEHHRRKADRQLSRDGTRDGRTFGSTETTFYVIAVYFGAVNIKQTRHAVPAGLTADLAAMVIAVWTVRLLFG